MQNTFIVYPAIIYKNAKKNMYVANCIIKNLIGFGKSETEAVCNLEKILNKDNNDFPIQIRPVKQLFSNLGSV